MLSLKPRTLNNLALQMSLIAGLLVNAASAQQKPPVPEQYQKYFVHYVDKRSIWDKVLNAINIESGDVGRSFALIAGISHYPNMGPFQEELKPAAEDVNKVSVHLKEYQGFDEIVLLEDANVTIDNLQYFLQTYFPKRLKKFPKSRFLFAYSGHGMTEDRNGYLLKNTARNLTDKDNSINLRVLKVYIDEVVRAGHYVLVLLNSCYSGAVFGREPFGGPSKFIPENRGAHAITAGGSGEIAWADPQVGTGSIFFEKIIAGLGGVADSDRDGVITAFDLARYIRREVQVFTDQEQNPLFRDISPHGSRGEFFFLSRQKLIAEGIVPEFKPEKATAMGINARQSYLKGKKYYDAGDYKSAFTCFRQSAEGGDSDGINSVGRMYYYGYEVKQDYAEAVRWFRKAADAGSGNAMFNLGNVHRDGHGVPQDYDVAKRWFLKAVEAGNAGAMNNLGIMYFEGYGGAKDFVKAAHCYRKGADMGLTESMVNLSHVYLLGGFGLKQDYAEALHWYRKAAEAGNADAMNNLGSMYVEGSGVAKDFVQATHWFLRGAEAGSARAMYQLGTFYELGQGGPQDHEKAQYWFRKSIETGDEWVIDKLRKPSATFKEKLCRIVKAAPGEFKRLKKPGSETEDGEGNVTWDPMVSLSRGIGVSYLHRKSGENDITYRMGIILPEDPKKADELWNQYLAEIEEATESLKGYGVRRLISEKYYQSWIVEKTGILEFFAEGFDIMAPDKIIVRLSMDPADRGILYIEID
jgi:TPR repeat protein